MRKLIVLLVVFLLNACAGVTWVHPTKNASDFESDKFECEGAAAAYADNWGSPGNVFMIADRMKLCLQARGWRVEETNNG